MAEYSDSKQTNDAKTTKEVVNKWHTKISDAEHRLKKISEKYRWADFIKEYKGDFSQYTQSLDIQVNPLNFVFAYVKTELPSLYLRDPLIKINPKKEATIASAKVLEASINYLWRTKKIKREVKKAILDAILVGTGWVKVGYTGKFGTIEENGVSLETIESEDFFCYRIPWDCVLFDSSSTDAPFDSSWIAHKLLLPLEDAKANPLYSNLDRIATSTSNKDAKNNYGSDFGDKYEDPMVCLYEVWDRKHNVVFTIADGVNDYIESPKEWPYELKGYPFSSIKFNWANEDPFGIPDVFMFEPQIIELMKARALQLDHIKRNNRQLLTTRNNFDDEGKSTLSLGITGVVVECDDPTKVLPLPYPMVQQDIWAIEERLKEDMINISGQSPQERGATQKTSTRTFKELAMQARGAENRRSEKVDIVEDFVEDISNNLVRIQQQYADVPYYARIIGEDSELLRQSIQNRPSANAPGAITANDGFTFTKEDIQGEYDLDVVAGSTTPLDRSQTLATLLEILQYGEQLGIAPGGPVAGAIGVMFSDQLDMPELKMAIKAEAIMKMQAQEEQKKEAEDAKEYAMTGNAARMQIDAENAATKQTKVLVDSLKLFVPNEKKTISSLGEK
jgi:hypothetical protein